jgi:sugar O-acyltransferase (sialic acid O-acetyltransferase NeuD family)
MSNPGNMLLIGAESSFCCEFLETMERAGIAVAASIVTGPAEWDMAEIGPIVPIEDIPPELRGIPFVVPWVAPGWRRERTEAAVRAGLDPLGVLADPTAVLPRALTIGSGIYINAGAVIGAKSSLGAGVLINRNASIGHHNTLDEYATIGPGATLGGRVTLGRGCFIGAGAVIAPGITIGANAVIASGASIHRDIPPNVLAAGNPFRIVKTGIAGYQGVGA